MVALDRICQNLRMYKNKTHETLQIYTSLFAFCAPEYFNEDQVFIRRVMALKLVKIGVLKFVLHSQ